MLSDFDWADRMAIPITFIQAVGQPVAAAFMQTFINWRIGGIDRDLWLRKVSMGAAHSMEVRNNRLVATMNESAFYNALRLKCVNLYGGTSIDADPLALVRHPWSLTAQEFEDAYEALTKQKLPSLPDDRERYGSMVSLYGGVPAIAGAILRMMGTAPTTAGMISIGGALASMAAAGSDHEKANAQTRQRAQIRENFSGYIAMYQREAFYRKKEVSV